MRKTERYTLGEWYLDTRTTKNKDGEPVAIWYRCTYDRQHRQTRRFSLSTSDVSEAKRLFNAWYQDSIRPVRAGTDSVLITDVLLWYYVDYIKLQKSKTMQIDTKSRSIIIGKYWNGKTIADLTPDAQKEFIVSLINKPYSAGSIVAILATLRAAMNRAFKFQQVAALIPILSIKDVTGGQVKNKLMGEVASPRELAKFFDCLGDPQTERGALIMLATTCRPAAAVGLTFAMCDFDNRIIDLNPPGREQTKKHRPAVRMPEFFYQLFSQYRNSPDNIVTLSPDARHTNFLSVKMRIARKSAGIEKKITPYSFRHSIARYIRANKGDLWATAAQLGHKVQMTTAVYTAESMEYLMTDPTLIDQHYQDVKKHSIRLKSIQGELSGAIVNIR